MEKEKRVLICPRCGSTKIMPHPSDKKHNIKHGSVLEAYYSKRICENCKYTGYFFPDVPANRLKKLQQDIKALKLR